MVQTLKKQMLYYILYLCNFLSIIAIRDTGSGMFVLLIVLPVCTTILGAICGLKQGFSLYYNLVIGFVTLAGLSIYIRQIDAVMVYTGIYVALSFGGNLVGSLLKKTKKN